MSQFILIRLRHVNTSGCIHYSTLDQGSQLLRIDLAIDIIREQSRITNNCRSHDNLTKTF